MEYKLGTDPSSKDSDGDGINDMDDDDPLDAGTEGEISMEIMILAGVLIVLFFGLVLVRFGP